MRPLESVEEYFKDDLDTPELQEAYEAALQEEVEKGHENKDQQ